MKKIVKLEADGLIKGVYLGNRNKHVYLTNEGIKYTVYDKTYEPVPEELAHDIQVGRIVQDLLCYSKVIDATMYHQIDNKLISPDAVIQMDSDEELFNVAIELELTQKSQTRVKAKFNRYNVSSEFDYCIFISQKETLIKTYQRFLKDLNPELSGKFFFIIMDEFSGFRPILDQMKCFYNGELITVKGLFGTKINDRIPDRLIPNPLRPELNS
jgi:hypothetical protein